MSAPKVPQYQPPPEDPQYIALKQQAEQDDAVAQQQRVQIDSASLMARYGTRLTLAAASGGSPTLAPQPSQSPQSDLIARALPLIAPKVA